MKIKRDYLTTRECAEVIRCDPAYVRAEIRAGLLRAEVICRRGGRNRIRIYPEEFREYLSTYWPRVEWNMDSAA